MCQQPSEGKTRQLSKVKNLFFGGYSILEEGRQTGTAAEVRHLHRNSSASNSSKSTCACVCVSVVLRFFTRDEGCIRILIAHTQLFC